MQKLWQTIALMVGVLFVSTALVSCGEKKEDSEDSGDKKTKTEEHDAVYAASLTYVKDAFCDCVSAGTEIPDCEKEANNSLRDISTEYALDDETEKEMYVQAGELMRSCIK